MDTLLRLEDELAGGGYSDGDECTLFRCGCRHQYDAFRHELFQYPCDKHQGLKEPFVIDGSFYIDCEGEAVFNY